MTTGRGSRRTAAWEAPRRAWVLARDTAAGCGPAAMKDIPPHERAEVIIALGAQVVSFLREAALPAPDPVRWEIDVPCARVRQLAAAAMAGRTVRVPAQMCGACTLAALSRLTGLLLEAMSAAGHRDLVATLDWLASRAR